MGSSESENGPDPNSGSAAFRSVDHASENAHRTPQQHDKQEPEGNAQRSQDDAPAGDRGLGLEALSDDLQLVVRRWDSLPEAVRAGIVAMVAAASDKPAK